MFGYSVFEDMTLCTDAEVRRMLPLVSPQRREYALRFKHVFGQFAALKSYLMLCDLLHADSLPPFVYNDYGKPLLPDGPFFSISHTKDAVAVAVIKLFA